MAALNFPSSPTALDEYTDPTGQLWIYNGTAWRKDTKVVSPMYPGPAILYVGTGGDFTTLRDAINYLSQFTRRGGTTSYSDTMVEVRINSGHVIEHQIVIRAVDLSWVKITSVDPVVYANENAFDLNWLESFSGLGDEHVSLFCIVDNATSPWINAQFSGPSNFEPTTHTEAGVITNVIGMSVDINSKGFIYYGGFQDFGYGLVTLVKSELQMFGGSLIVSSGGWIAIEASNNCNIKIAESTITINNGNYGVYISSSNVNINSSSISGVSGTYAHRPIDLFKCFTILVDVVANYHTGSAIKTRRVSHTLISGGNYRILPTGGSDNTTDIFVGDASIIQLHNVVGGYSQTANTITSSGLIIS